MVTEELLSYMQAKLAAGMSRLALKQTLTAAGDWNERDIEEALAMINPASPIAAQPPTSPQAAPQAPTISPTAALASPGTILNQYRTPVAPPPRQSSGWRRVAIFAAIVVCVALAGSAAAYYQLVVRTPAPQEMLRMSFLAMAKTPSFAFAATTTGQLSGIQSSSTPITVNFTLSGNGVVDRHEPEHLAFDTVMDGALSGNMATDTGSAVFGAHVIFLNDKLYLDLTNFTLTFKSSDLREASAQLFVVLVNGIAASLENKWIEADASSTSITAGTNVLNASAIAADRTALQQYVAGGSFITSLQNVGTDTINSTPTYHLKITVRFEQQFADLLEKLQRDQIAPLVGTTSIDAQTNEALARWIGKEMGAEVWIGKSDYRVYQVVVNPITIPDPTTHLSDTLSASLQYSDYGKQFSIIAPQDVESFEELGKQLFGSFTSTGVKAKK